jgi:uncharacterized membrane protein
MGKGRLEAFTDGVIAIIITIMVLELKIPHGSSLADLRAELPIFLAYALSYVNIGLIWNNHHHMLSVTRRINGAVLWANLMLLFWMSLMPFVIRWMGEVHFAPVPTAAYGVILILMGLSYVWLERAIIACEGPDSKLAQAVGDENKGKLSMALYALAVPLALVRPWIAVTIYVLVAMMWFVPDRRIEAKV